MIAIKATASTTSKLITQRETRTAVSSCSSAGTGRTSRVSCHVDVAAPERRESVLARCANNANTMMAAMIAERYASDA